VLDAEIQRILDMGVELKLNTAVGRDITLEQLRERHAALYLGIGAQLGRALGVAGEEGPSVWTGTDYLFRLNRGEQIELGGRVLVIGGGNTAVDAARSARRSGAEVTIVYRRTRVEMPAVEHEIEDALEEGIEFLFLLAPVRVKRAADETLTGLVACRMELGDKDASGRRRPVEIPDSAFTLSADSIIAAVSQLPELDGFESLSRDGNWFVTDAAGSVGDGVLAGGDALGLGVAGNAISQGRLAAEELIARFSSEQPVGAEDERPAIGPEQVRFDYKPESPAAQSPKLPGEERIRMGSAEVARTISEEQFLAETERCFSCGSCFGCEQCSMYCTTGCFTRLEEVSQGMYFTLALDQCHECGKCVEVCPCGFLEIV